MIKIIDKTELSTLRNSDLNLDQKAEIEQEIRDQIICVRESLADASCPVHGDSEGHVTLHLRLLDNYRLYFDLSEECCESILTNIPPLITHCLKGIHTDPPAYEPEC